ncbi:L,D-transpeptidase family protein [Polymorphobacter sp.]|uniref:L,D-transpeptidase family protein n=1 Tax=Polymorphobacter sp. TaxID=1909290 RepID=UPI003F710411
MSVERIGGAFGRRRYAVWAAALLMTAACQPVAEREGVRTVSAGREAVRPARFEPVFTGREALGDRPGLLLTAFSASGRHGRDPAAYRTPGLEAAVADAAGGDEAALRRADAALVLAFLAWARDLDEPAGVAPVVTDPAAVTSLEAGALVRAAAKADDLAGYLAALQQRHPLYEAMADAMAAAPAATPAEARVRRLNLERARALPARPEGKHVVVDAAGARLWMYEGRREVGSMVVVVGKASQATPLMSGVIRHVVARPYWNVPEDLARDVVARAVLRNGVKHVAARDMEIMSGWEPDAVPVDPKAVDWKAVAAGTVPLRVRQRPGPRNMMGRVKFMLPNDLGIYLHDTPDRGLFKLSRRALSSGCVRVADAERLAEWLFDGTGPLEGAGVDETLPLPVPVPVYISYFTRAPGKAGLQRQADVYKRDLQG